MKTITSIKQYLLLFFLGTFLIGCSSDDEPLVIADDEEEMELGDTNEISLLFTTETEEDQIGQFANNAMVEYDGSVWAVGGYIGSGPPYFISTNQVWRSENGANWLSVSTDQFPARVGHTLNVIDDKMFMIGGRNNDTPEDFGDIWSSTDGLTWVLENNASIFGEVYYHTVTELNGRWYLIFGSSVWSSANGLDWTLETNEAFPNRNFHKTIVFNNELFVIGGLDEFGSRVNDIWRSTDGINWTQVSPTGTPFTPRNFHTVTAYNGKIWVIGGRNGTVIYRDIYYSSDMIHWTQYELEPDSDGTSDGLYAHSTLLYNDALWIFGGYNSVGASSKISSIKEE